MVFHRIGIRDYEQIKERPEETLAKIAREEEEAMRRERKIRQQREYASGSAVNTITGAARYVRRPTMSAEYLAAGGFDDEDGDGEVGDNHEPDYYGRERRQPPQKPKAAPKAKAPKRKVAAPSDYLEYDEEEGSEADEDEEEDGEDGSEMEDDVVSSIKNC